MKFTTITYPGQLMGKEYRSGQYGKTIAHTDGQGFHGHFKVEDAPDLHTLNSILDNYDLSQIMVHGVPRHEGETIGYVHSGVPQRYMDLTAYVDIQRTKEDLIEYDGPAVGTLDSDFDHAPSWTQFIQTPEQHYKFLTSVISELQGVGMLVRPSGSNGVVNADGTPYKTTRNFHTHFACCGDERVALLERLHALFALRGYAWIMIGSSGALLERSPADLALRTNNQPVFAARPRVVAPVTGQRPESFIAEGRALRLSDLPEVDEAEVRAVFDKRKQAPKLVLRQTQAKIKYQKDKARKTLAMLPRPTVQEAKAELKRQRVQAIEREKAWAGDALGPDFIIYTKQYGPLTVAQLLASPDKYHEAKTCDPMEPEYRGFAQTGILYLEGNHLPVCVSLAHGQSKRYKLRGHMPFDIDQLLELKALPDKGSLSALRPTMSLGEGSSLLWSTVCRFYTHPRNVGARV